MAVRVGDRKAIRQRSRLARFSGLRIHERSARSVFKRNMGTGGIECVGVSKPKINHNNIFENAVGIQAFSTILIDARNNWWGKAPPDPNMIWGDNVNIEPWLETPQEKAFQIDD